MNIFQSPRIIDYISIYVILAFSLTFISCGSLHPQEKGTKPVDHSIFDSLLKQYVDTNGNVDYTSLLKESDQLDKYLALLSSNAPNDEHWSKEDQLAYWINAYNAYTIKLILNNYPLESIKDIGSNIQVPFVNTPWDIKFIEIAGKTYDLNNIEHNIIRKNFDEPRIHFALVCASFSCPRLRGEAYIGSKIDEQLTDQTKNFLEDSNKNIISEDEIRVSKLFNWYKGDFTKGQKLIEFLNKYAPVTINSNATVKHMNYDWSLNEQ